MGSSREDITVAMVYACTVALFKLLFECLKALFQPLQPRFQLADLLSLANSQFRRPLVVEEIRGVGFPGVSD